MLDQRGQLLRAAVGFAGCSLPTYDRALWALRTWLDSWPGIGHIAVGMHRQGFDLQLTQYDDRGWRATFYTAGVEQGQAVPEDAGLVEAADLARFRPDDILVDDIECAWGAHEHLAVRQA